jgi:NitT/TauT family transport system substrate-binding protein
MRMLVLLLVAVATVGCGTGRDGGAYQDRRPTEVRVGVLPIAAVAPVHVAIERGYFADEGLEVTPAVAQGGAALIPAVLGGDYQFAYTNNVSVIQAGGRGLPVGIVTDGAQAGADQPAASDAIVVRSDSRVRQPSDLQHATIGVNSINNVGDVVIRAALEREGIDTSTVEFLEVPFPDMIATVEAGRVDAGWVVEPFVQAAKARGLRSVLSPLDVAAGRLDESLSIASYVTSERYARANPKVVTAFTRAMERSFRHLEDNPDDLRRAVTRFTEIPASVADRMGLPSFTADATEESLRFFAGRMVEYGMIERAPDPHRLLLPAGR